MRKSEPGDHFPGPNASNGAMADIFKFWVPFSGKKCQNHCTILNFWASRNSEADPPDPPDPPETQHGQQNRPWVPHAGGQDDGS